MIRYSFVAVVFLIGCTQNVIDDAPRYAGARASSGQGGGAYMLINGRTDASGCGVGMSEAPVHGRFTIEINTETCFVKVEQ